MKCKEVVLINPSGREISVPPELFVDAAKSWYNDGYQLVSAPEDVNIGPYNDGSKNYSKDVLISPTIKSVEEDKPCVVHLIGEPLRTTGLCYYVSQLAEYTAQSYKVHIIAPSNELSDSLFPNCEVHMASKEEISSLLKQLNPTIIHNHTSIEDYIDESLRSKQIMTNHNWKYNLPKHLTESSIPVCGPEVKIRHGIDLKEFFPVGDIRTTSDKYDVGIIGRIDPGKIPEEFVEELSKCQDNDITFHVYGPTLGIKSNESIKDRLAQLPNVIVHNEVPRCELPPVYRSLNAVLIPSKSEAVNLVAIEAMSCGIPVIVNDIQGLRDTVDSAGIICKTNKAMFDSLIKLKNDKKLQAKLSKNCVYRAKRFFDINRMFNQYSDVYNQVSKGVINLPIAEIESGIYKTKKPKIGMILRADYGGLARVSEDWFKHIKPHKTLTIDMGNSQFREKLFPESKTNKVCKFKKQPCPSLRELREFMKGLDIIITFETPYNWDMFDMARRRGIRTLMMCDYEYLPDPMPSKPDVLWMPVDWYLDDIARDVMEPTFIDMPIDRKLFNYKNRKTAKRFVCVLGHHNIKDDRNGAQTILQAIPFIQNQDIKIVLHSIDELPEINDPRVEVHIGAKENPADNWKDGDVFVYPRRYAGLSLPMLEALSCGLPVLMTDMSPQDSILPKHWLIRPNRLNPYKLDRQIEVATLDPQVIAAKIDEWAMKPIGLESELADTIADEMSWDNLYEEIMNGN